MWKEVKDARKSHPEQVSSSGPEVKERTDVKNSNSLKASPATRVKKKFLVYGWQDEKDRHVIIGIIPCVVGYKSGNRCICGIRCFFFDMLMRSNLSAGSRKEGTQGTVAVVREKTNVQGCVSQDSDPVSSVLRKVEELGLNASAGHTRNSQDASGTKLKLGKEKGNLEAWSKEVNLMSEILRARFWGMDIWGNLVTSRLWQQSSVEFVLKKAQCWAREFYAQIEGILRGEGPKTPCRYWPRRRQCK